MGEAGGGGGVYSLFIVAFALRLPIMRSPQVVCEFLLKKYLAHIIKVNVVSFVPYLVP